MSFVQNNQLLAVTSASEVAMISDCNAASLPTGYLYPNGQTVNTADYPELAAARGESGATMVMPGAYPLKEYSEADGDFSISNAGASWVTTSAVAVPYVTSNGKWRIKFNIRGTMAGAANVSLTFSGVTFPSVGQAINARPDASSSEVSPTFGYAYSSSTLVAYFTGGTVSIQLSGDVEMTSKPSFVLANSPTNYDTYKVIRYAPKTALQGTYEERPKNYIGNGDMTVCQSHSATATGTAATTGDDIVDRFKILFQGGATFDKWRDESTIPYALVADVTATDTPTGTDVTAVRYIMEGYEFQDIKDKTITITFDVYGKAGTYSLVLSDSAYTTQYITEYDIDADSTWQTITKTITIDTSTGTWLYTNGIGLALTWTISCGATYQTSSTDQWTTGGTLLAGSNQDNGTAGTGTDYDFKLRNVALYKGSYTAATLPEFRPKNDSYEANLAECQRYYWKTIGATTVIHQCYAGGTTNHIVQYSFPVEMRSASATITKIGTWYKSNVTTIGLSIASANSMYITISPTAAGYISIQTTGANGFTADARL